MQSKEPLAELGELKDSLMNTSPMLGIALTAGVVGMLMGVMNKMFGNTEKIPKGVVKELMEGVVSGLMEHFEMKIEDLKSDVERLEKDLEHVTTEKACLSDALEVAQSKINELTDEKINKDLEEEKNKILKKKK